MHIGDTFGTCMGPLSRNRQVGVRLAKGECLEHIIATSDTTEGVATALALQKLLMTKVDPRIVDFKFPIISGVTAILNGHLTPSEGLTSLMRYPVRDENDSFY
jgi:glycerol-3-phosphate dehydrogenase